MVILLAAVKEKYQRFIDLNLIDLNDQVKKQLMQILGPYLYCINLKLTEAKKFQ